MIDLKKELYLYGARVVALDPRVQDVIDRARPVFEDMGTKGGYQRGFVLAINPKATDEHQRETLGHELAHLLEEQLTPDKSMPRWSAGASRGHGYIWAWWMGKLGLKPDRFHDHEELIRQGSRVYLVTCFDCRKQHVRTFVPRVCPDKGCESPDVQIDRADGIGGARYA